MPEWLMSMIYSEYLPSISGQAAPELVLLHGWGIGSDIWRPCLGYLRRHYHITLVDLPGFGRSEHVAYRDCRSLLTHLLKHLPDRAIYMGFSMGGMLAVQAAHHFPERVLAVVTVASNACFVAHKHWPQAMARSDFSQFCAAVAQNPDKTLNRFLALQAKGCESAVDLLKQLHQWFGVLSGYKVALNDTLTLLASIDNERYLRTMPVPLLAMFGAHDALVPLAAAQRLQTLLVGQVTIVDGASHVPFLSHPKACWQALEHFLQAEDLCASTGVAQTDGTPLCAVNAERHLDKYHIAQSFSRAATHYDDVAHLQREVGEQLLAQLPSFCVPPERVLDLGCGTGYFIDRLQQHYQPSDLLGIDIAEGMLTVAKRRHRGSYLCADAEHLPLASGSVDLIFANLSIQWCEHYEALFAEAYRVLKPGGYFAYTTLGPRTLHELRTAWLAVDRYVHVNAFVEQAVLACSIARARLQWQHRSEKMIVKTYRQLDELTRELKQLGVHNLNRGRCKGLLGKHRMQRFRQAYECQRTAQGWLSATYQVWYGVLTR